MHTSTQSEHTQHASRSFRLEASLVEYFSHPGVKTEHGNSKYDFENADMGFEKADMGILRFGPRGHGIFCGGYIEQGIVCGNIFSG